MVQEFCGSHPDMFQTPPSPVTSSRGGGGGGPVLGGGHSSLQQTSALASSAMASTYGYHPFHAAYHQQGGYSDYYHQLQGPPPSSSGASEVQLSGLTPLVPGGGGGGGGGNGSASPGPWSTGCTYPTSISPRSGTAGAGGLQEDSWAAFGSPMVSSMASQLGQPMQGSYYGQTHPHSRATPNAFDPMGLGQYGTTAASQSPASVGGMHGLHGGAGGGGGPQQSHSPDQPTSVIQSTGGAGMPGARHARPPYDWMKKQTTYQSAPSNDDPTSPKSKTRTKDKYRIVYSEYQKVELEKEYLYSKYITIQRKAELSRAIQLSERQVKIWFQNRRAKERKQKRKREDIQMSANSSSEVHSPDDSNDPDQHQHDVMKMEMDSPHHAPPPQQHQTQHPSHQPQQHHIVDGHHLVKAEMMQQPPSMHPSEYNAPPNPHSQIIVPH